MFTVEIVTDNDAFSTYGAGEVARILQKIARQIVQEGTALDITDGGKVMDVNGNSVGRWEVRP